MDRSNQITSEDVARRAGVSRTTVSLVLNNKYKENQISSKTVERVIRAAQELGYVPNAAAQALVSKRSGVIGLLLSRYHHQIASDVYLNQVVDGLIEVAHENNMRVLLDIIEDNEDPLSYQKIINARQVDGIIYSGPRQEDRALEHLGRTRFPTVLMGALKETHFHSVDVDNVKAAKKATEHLISLGHRRIACITNATPNYTAAADRLLGYRLALQEHNIQEDDRLVRYGDFDPESGFRAMQGLLSVQPRPSAVFVASDVVAFGALSALQVQGIYVPQGMAVIGFDDVPLSAFFHPKLSSIHLPIHDLAREAGKLLIQLLNGQTPQNKHIILDTHLVIRNSCGAKL